MAPSLSSKRASHRFSTYSTTPSIAASTDSAKEEIHQIGVGLDKLENKKLGQQRFVPTPEKSENLSKLALGAKLDRALDRRLGSQDAVMRVKGETQEKETVAT